MFAIPSLKDLVERARARFEANLPGSDAHIWPNNLNPTAKVIGGMTHEVFGFADYIQRQKFALTADSENLDLHGAELGLARRPAAPARGVVTVTADDAVTIAVGAVFSRSDGIDYLATAGGALTGAGTIDVDVVASTDGQATVAIAGTALEIASGVVTNGTAAAAVGSAGIVNGVDVEDDETFRARILFRKRNPPMGGSAADYVQWAGEVSGVSFDGNRPTVFVERLWAGPGTVRVFPLMFDLYADGIPQAADVTRVSDYLAAVQPAGAVVTVAAPIAKPIAITIDGLSPDRTDVRLAIAAELRDAFRRLGRVAGVDRNIDGMPFLAYPTSFSRSWIWQAVANASGEQRHTIVAPDADVALDAGEYPTLGTITFT
jgi:uncharacterized phage protein gp47/JayE